MKTQSAVQKVLTYVLGFVGVLEKLCLFCGMSLIESLPYIPQRIVSLVPSQTELLFDLGLGDRVVGITKFCIHPAEQVKTKTLVGGTKNFRFDVIDTLKPDLILANKEENYKEGIEQLAANYPVWMSDLYTLEDALAMMEKVGKLTGVEEKANTIVLEVKTRFAGFVPAQSRRVAYFIWQNPMMVAASHTFINDLLQRCGLENVFDELSRYPEISEAQLQQAAPEWILLSSEPFPFAEKHIRYFQELCPQSRVLLVDGEMFSWYGSHLLQAVDYFDTLLKY